MKTVDLNCDLGEAFGAYTHLLVMDEQILPYISSANIACGFHASDPVTMQKTVAAAVHAGVSLGAHPGLPDLVGFGRRTMAISPQEAEASVVYQVGALQAFAHAAGTELHHVKPHGALYNMAAKDAALAEAICRGVRSCGKELVLVALFGSEMVRAAQKLDVPYACEVFADRAYQDDGTLVPRSQPGAVITDESEAVSRSVRMVTQGVVTTVSGKDIPVQADTICVHGDNPKALAFVQNIRNAFTEAGVAIKHF
ncbi:MAG: LamB/YcsF family protein [Treponema sp.]|nr:LamB/YcsF family protein [Treponema sp.]